MKQATKPPAKRAPKPDDPEQSKRFKETAKQLDVDTREALFDCVMDVVVPPKVQDSDETSAPSDSKDRRS